MSTARSRQAFQVSRALVAGVLLAALAWQPSGFADEPKAELAAEQKSAAPVDGKELFTREWLPGDKRSHGGDGLGPVFNDSSCVGCHNQGGIGGGGAAAKNVDIVTVFANRHAHREQVSLVGEIVGTFFGGTARRAQRQVQDAAARAEMQKKIVESEKKQIDQIHPGFRTARSLVLHKSSTKDGYDNWRNQLTGSNGHFSFHHVGAGNFELLDEGGRFEPHIAEHFGKESPFKDVDQKSIREALVAMQRAQADAAAVGAFSSPAQIGDLAFLRSQRNTTSLFGAGKIDRATDEAIEAAAEKKHTEFPEISGRVAKLKDGRIGRFGWKGQTASLQDFVVTACAIELGLEVPGHGQAGVPSDAKYKAPGMDLDQKELVALTSYVRELPAPARRKPANDHEGQYIAGGEKLFTKVGCAACHTENLGEAHAIYSDLLLHDMGRELSDQGAYGVFVPNSGDQVPEDEPLPNIAAQFEQRATRGTASTDAEAVRREKEKEAKTIGALQQEWRTPPLWGVRDSAPYMHDGRAATLESAIALHGGEGAPSAQRFFLLKPEERMQVTAFLKSLTAP